MGGHFQAEKNWGAFWRLLTQKRAFSKSNLLLTLHFILIFFIQIINILIIEISWRRQKFKWRNCRLLVRVEELQPLEFMSPRSSGSKKFVRNFAICRLRKIHTFGTQYHHPEVDETSKGSVERFFCFVRSIKKKVIHI